MVPVLVALAAVLRGVMRTVMRAVTLRIGRVVHNRVTCLIELVVRRTGLLQTPLALALNVAGLLLVCWGRRGTACAGGCGKLCEHLIATLFGRTRNVAAAPRRHGCLGRGGLCGQPPV